MGLRGTRRTRLATPAGLATAMMLALFMPGPLGAQPPQAKPEAPKEKLGLLVNEAKAFQGYTLLAPMNSTKTYLIDMQGKVVRTWESDCTPALTPYLLENGHLFRPGVLGAEARTFGGNGPGAGGRVQEFTWEGEVVWDFKLVNEKQLPHHDATRLPNGNVLLIVWDKKSAEESLAAGRRPQLVGNSHLLPDCLIEVKPTGKTTGEVVWEWHLWDHLVQDFDSTKANYGKVAEHPELVNINYGEDALAPIAASKDGQDKLKSIGYVGNNPPGRPGGFNADWTHFNCVAYNPDLDQVVVSVHNFSEFWIIDHSTTTAEAASHKGGRGGKGGDLLYRWGNPLAYRAGKKADQKLFAQHNAHWIPRGLPGAGHLLVFNNGMGRPDGSYSTVDELALPVDAKGHYAITPGSAYGPDKPIWSYVAPKKTEFFSMLISGAQRLPNGDTLICSGVNGTVFEVTAEKETVWKYVNPVKDARGPGGRGGFGPGGFGGPPPGGRGGFGGPGGPGGPPQPGEILPMPLQEILRLTEEQKKQVSEFQTDLSGKLDKVLTDDQRKQWKEPQGGGPGAFGGRPQPGQLMAPTVQARLKLTAEQKKQVEELQKEVDAKLDKLLTDDQQKQFKEMRQAFARGGPGGFGPPGGGPGGPGGRGGFGGFPGFGGPSGSSLFRSYRYAANYPGLVGKELTPGKTVEELQPAEGRGRSSP